MSKNEKQEKDCCVSEEVEINDEARLAQNEDDDDDSEQTAESEHNTEDNESKNSK